jgi:tetratricopeptide (TPR) repeat protein
MNRSSTVAMIIAFIANGCDTPDLPQSTPHPVPTQSTATGAEAQKPAKGTIASGSSAPLPKTISFDSCFAEGQKLLDDGDNQSAIAALTEAIAADPSVARAYNSRGVAHLRMMSLGSALEDFSKAIEIGPPEARFYANRAMVYSDKENYTDAIADLTHAIQLEPTYSAWRADRAHIYSLMGDDSRAQSDRRAIEDLKSGIKLNDQLTDHERSALIQNATILESPVRGDRGKLTSEIWDLANNEFKFRKTRDKVFKSTFRTPRESPKSGYLKQFQNRLKKPDASAFRLI